MRRGHSERYLERQSISELMALQREHLARDAQDRWERNEDRAMTNGLERREPVGDWGDSDPDGPAWSEKPFREYQQALFEQAHPELATPEGRAWLAYQREEAQFERDARAIEALN